MVEINAEIKIAHAVITFKNKRCEYKNAESSPNNIHHPGYTGQ